MKTSLQLFVALFLLTIVAHSAFAREINIVTISNDESAHQYKLVLEVSDKTGDILKFHKDKFDPKVKGTTISRETFVVSKLDLDGFVVEKKDKYEILKIKSDNFASHNGGDLIMDVLHNGVNGERKEFDFELVRLGDNWELERDGKRTHHIHFVSKKVFVLGTVGVKDIVVQ